MIIHQLRLDIFVHGLQSANIMYYLF